MTTWYRKVVVPCNEASDGETPSVLYVAQIVGMLDWDPTMPMYGVVFSDADKLILVEFCYERDRAIEACVALSKMPRAELEQYVRDCGLERRT
jgi:hypothetical protein